MVRIAALACPLVCSLLGLVALRPAEGGEEARPAVWSEVRETDVGELVLVQHARIEAPVEEVWASYTTAEGWQAWAAPVAEVDLRVGGTIRTHYTPGASIGDPGTNTLHVLGYVPNEVLMLRAEVGDNWPAVLREDADRMSNVVVFDRLGPNETRVRSFGIGYSAKPAVKEMLGFFQEANERLMRELVQHLEG